MNVTQQYKYPCQLVKVISIINNSFTILLVSLYYIGSIRNILNVDVACHRTLARFYDFFSGLAR